MEWLIGLVIFLLSAFIADVTVKKVLGNINPILSIIGFIIFIILSNIILSNTLAKELNLFVYFYSFLTLYAIYILVFVFLSGFGYLSKKVSNYLGYGRSEDEIMISLIRSMLSEKLNEEKIKSILKKAKFRNVNKIYNKLIEVYKK